MFFILSKVLGLVVMPVFVITGFLIASALVKKQHLKKRFFYIALSILLFCTNSFISNEVMRVWEVPITLMKDVKTYEWGILLTGITKTDTGPEDRIYFTSGADRVTHTVQLYKMGKVKKILVSGGSGRITAPEKKEAYLVAEALKLMGVPQEDIVTEVQSRNTHESAEEVKKMLKDKFSPEQCLLITSAYHMRRSAACYKKAGWKTDCFSVDFQSHFRNYTPDDFFIPKVEALYAWHVLIREWTGMIAYKIAGYI